MKDKVFKYKGQLGSVEPDLKRGNIYGKLLYINDLVTYEAETVPDLEREFRAAVDDYLNDCADLGVEPNRPFKGSFNVRVGEDLHREMVLVATDLGVSLNEACVQAFKCYVAHENQSIVEHYHNHTHVHFEAEKTFDLEIPADTSGTGGWSVSESKPKLAAVN